MAHIKFFMPQMWCLFKLGYHLFNGGVYLKVERDKIVLTTNGISFHIKLMELTSFDFAYIREAVLINYFLPRAVLNRG